MKCEIVDWLRVWIQLISGSWPQEGKPRLGSVSEWRLRIRASQASLKLGPKWIRSGFRWKLNDTSAYWAVCCQKWASNDKELIILHLDPSKLGNRDIKLRKSQNIRVDSVNSSAKLANPKLMREGSAETAASPSTSAHFAFQSRLGVTVVYEIGNLFANLSNPQWHEMDAQEKQLLHKLF